MSDPTVTLTVGAVLAACGFLVGHLVGWTRGWHRARQSPIGRRWVRQEPPR